MSSVYSWVMFLTFFMILVGGWLFFVYNHHFLMMLLSLELMMLSVWVLSLSLYSLGGWYVFFYLILVVCMGGFGVSILIFVVRLLRNYLFFMF